MCRRGGRRARARARAHRRRGGIRARAFRPRREAPGAAALARERDGGMLEPPRIILAQALLQLALPLAAVGSESEVLPGAAHRAEQHRRGTGSPATIVADVNVDISSSGLTSPFPHFWERVFGSGHGALTLRSDWQRAATQATEELGLKAVRFHGLFDEDMHVLSRDQGGKLVYNWSSIDASFDFMKSVVR